MKGKTNGFITLYAEFSKELHFLRNYKSVEIHQTVKQSMWFKSYEFLQFPLIQKQEMATTIQIHIPVVL